MDPLFRVHRTAKRWMIDDNTDNGNNNNKTIRLLGTYVGHNSSVEAAAELDSSTLVTVSYQALKTWNKTTCECLRSETTVGHIMSLRRTKDKSRIVCGMADGAVEMRRTNDLAVISSFKLHSRAVRCLYELSDGLFVSGSDDAMVKRWDENGTVLQTFSGHSRGVIRLMELNSDVVVASSVDNTVTV